MEATMDEDTEQQQTELHPLDEPLTQPIQRQEPTPEPVVVRRGRGLGGNRHMSSVLLSFLGVLGAYGALDYGFYKSLGPDQTVYLGGEVSDQALVALGAAAACMFLAALAGRISGLGPLLAGLVLGAGPCAWIVLDHASYVERLNDVPNIWGSHTTFGLVAAGIVIYPIVAGMLLGAAFAGRWRRPAYPA
jgi:hypothetical protein